MTAAPITNKLIGANLLWKRTGSGWQLLDGRRRFGDVVPDAKYPNMWRSVLSGGQLSDMANLTWARHAVMDAAIRELEWEARSKAATDPQKCPEKGGVLSGASPPVRQIKRAATQGRTDWPPATDEGAA